MTSTRIISALIFFVFFLFGLFAPHSWIPQPINFLLALFPPVVILAGTLIGVWEFSHLGEDKPPTLQVGLALGGAVLLLADGYFYSFQHGSILLGLLAMLTIAAGLPLKDIDIAAVAGKSVLAPIYVALPLALIVRLWRDNLDSGAAYPHAGAHYILFLILVTWASDAGAYFAGRSFGKTKIVPRLSPGKTLEGYIGGAIATIIVAVVIKLAWNNIDELFNWRDVIVISLIFSVVAPIGDLVESQFKRSAAVKDSGLTFTGHGGMLDIIDSLLFTTIVYVAYLSIFYPAAFKTTGGF